MLFSAGLLSGIVNAIAGGGSFISFPALVFVGVPPLFANATNTYASCAGYISGAYAFKNELLANKKVTLWFSLAGMLGGILGGYALLQFSNDSFAQLIPWLLLFALVLFVFGPAFNRFLASRRHAGIAANTTGIFGVILILSASIYGGFFNAGLGIILLSFLVILGFNRMALMNGIKLLVSTMVSIFALVIFVYEDMLAWYLGTILLLGNMLGAYVSAIFSQHLSDRIVRNVVIVISTVMTVYFFYDVYLA